MILFDEGRGLDPTTLGGFASSDGSPAFSMFDSLMRWDDATNSVVPQLAESLTTTDSIVWTMKLRPNVKFTDGTPLDADAVVFNTQRLQQPQNKAAFGAAAAGQIATMVASDPTTVVFTLKAKSPLFAVNFTNRLAFVGSPTAIKAEGQDFGSKPVGAGPFMLKEWVRGDHLTMVRNPNYWNAPRPYLDSITYKPVPDVQQRVNSLNAGEAQLTYANDGLTISTFVDKKWQYKTLPLNGGTGLMFNNKRAPFNDASLRVAVGEAINEDDMNNVVFSGQDKIGRNMFATNSPFYSSATKPPEYNPADAKKLIDAYKASHGGGPITFTFDTFTVSTSQALAQFVQSVLKPYGVNVNIEVGDTNATVAKVQSGNYDMTHWGLNLGAEPEPQLSLFFTGGSAGNYSGFSNPEMDAGLTLASSTTDLATRKTGYAEVQKVFNAQVPYLQLALPTEGVIANPKVGGIRLSSNNILMTDELTIKP
jgi:peptide/nickel transport system substrate-binding protein